MTLPATLVASMLPGVWLMVAPAVLGGTGWAADSDRLVGALVVTVAAVSTAEVVRAARFVNLLFAAWLLVAPWLLAGGTAAGAWNGVLSALALAALTLARGPVRERYARWDRWIV